MRTPWEADTKYGLKIRVTSFLLQRTPIQKTPVLSERGH